MSTEDMDRLLERHLSGDLPAEVFRTGALQDSLAALAGVRRRRMRWRITASSAAAVLLAAASFLCGRYSVPRPPAVVDAGAVEEPRRLPDEPVESPAVADAGAVAVPKDLVAWLDAARLFRQLGMEDRMARAVDRAGKLLPVDAIAADSGTSPALAAGGEAFSNEGRHTSPPTHADLRLSFENMNRIMAQSFGD